MRAEPARGHREASHPFLSLSLSFCLWKHVLFSHLILFPPLSGNLKWNLQETFDITMEIRRYKDRVQVARSLFRSSWSICFYKSGNLTHKRLQQKIDFLRKYHEMRIQVIYELILGSASNSVYYQK